MTRIDRRTNIDRRRFVTALGAATALPAMTGAAAAAQRAAAKKPARPPGQATSPNCFVSYSWSAERPRSNVDFWSQPCWEIKYRKYLPQEIGLGVIEYDWWEKSPEWVIRVDGNLAPVLASLINAKEARTAFIALDSISLGVGDEWSKVLPAFRSCYDRIVGHFHLKEGGLRQWKQGLDESYPEKNGKSYFETFFCDAAAQCDAVILTSPALVACDLGLTPGAPIGCMVGQQIRRLGHALLDSTALDSITSAGETPSTRKPRLFALGSSSFYWPAGPQPAELQHNFDWSFARQGELVRNSFGVRGEDASPLVYTRFHDYPQEAAAIIRPLDGEWMHMYKLPEPTYDLPGSSWVRALELIALWPCEMDGQ